jgi:rubrerythrin
MASISRRDLLRGSAVAAGAGIVAGTQFLNFNRVSAQFNSDIDILNYALTLEHLEYAFYRDGLAQLGAGAFGGFAGAGPQSVYNNLIAIRDHEGAHVNTLRQVIQSLGGTPVEEAQYNFGYTDAASFIAVAQALENTGVSAYDGAVRFVQTPDLAEAAATIATVEARHAAYLNLLNGASPFPAAFDTPLSQAQVLAIAGPFIVSAPAPAPAPSVGLSITTPTANQVVSGNGLSIVGTAQLLAGQDFYKVEIRGGQFGSNWVTVDQTSSTSVSNGELAFLGPVSAGSYELRIVVVDSGNFAAVSNTVPFTVR